MKQLVAQHLPIGYIDMDRYYTNNDEYRPFISAFLPASNNYTFYDAYRYRIRLIRTT